MSDERRGYSRDWSDILMTIAAILTALFVVGGLMSIAINDTHEECPAGASWVRTPSGGRVCAIVVPPRVQP